MALPYYMNRELSWLEFNSRVLSLTKEANITNRFKFLNIYQSNLDEFFRVRVGALLHRAAIDPDYVCEETGMNNDQELQRIYDRVWELSEDQESAYKELITKLIEKHDIVFNGPNRHLKEIYKDYKRFLGVYIVGEKDQIPFLDNGAVYVIARLKRGKKRYFGFVDISRIPKFFETTSEDSSMDICDASTLVCYFIHHIFKGYKVKSYAKIRLLRNADIYFNYDPISNPALDREYDDKIKFKEKIRKLIKDRKSMSPVRLEYIVHNPKDWNHFDKFLGKKLKLEGTQIVPRKIPFSVDFLDLTDIRDKEDPEKLIPIASDRTSGIVPTKAVTGYDGHLIDFFRHEEVLLQYPYHTMSTFINLLYEAGNYPGEVSIDITLYRMAEQSRIAAALAYAASQGKTVRCVIELRARFDEEHNVDYSELLEKSGCKIYYGLPEYKVHGKACLIKGQDPKTGDSWAISQIGTGNYNEITSKMYSDLSFITYNTNIAKGLDSLFTSLRNNEVPSDTGPIITSPKNLKTFLLEKLDKEIEKAHCGLTAWVDIKVNSISDPDIIKKLVECSQNGVHIRLHVRGICCILPGIPDYTENIEIYSVVGDFLEHSRIYWFGLEECYIGSADLLTRNTERRIEILVPIESKKLKNMLNHILTCDAWEEMKVWRMTSDGSYTMLPRAHVDYQMDMYRRASEIHYT